MRHTKLIGGKSCEALTRRISERLGLEVLGVESATEITGEMTISLSNSVRGEDVYIVQSGFGDVLANDAVMELAILISACKMSSAKRVTAIVPFFPYSKQCKKKNRGTITAKLVANMLCVAGVDHIMTMDLHSSQLQGFFQVPVDNLVAEPTIAMYIQSNVPDYQNGVVVAKNAGATKRVTSLAGRLSIDFALIQKVQKVRGEETENVWTLVGEAQGKVAFILDDMIDSTKTFIKAAKALLEQGATKVYIIVTHALFSKDNIQRLEECEYVQEVIVTNTVPIALGNNSSKFKVIDVSPTFAEAIRRTHNGESVSFLFNNVPQ